MNTPSNPRFSVVPQAGTPLGPNWQKEAKLRALTADQHYKYTMENAWKGNPNSLEVNTMRAARLQPPTWSDVLGEK